MTIDFAIFSCFYFVFGTIIIEWFRIANKSRRYSFQFLSLALLFRMLLTYYYYYFSLSNAADSRGYFDYASAHHFELAGLLSPGLTFINNLTVIILNTVSFFSNPYLMLFIPYSFIGFIGSLLFFKIIEPYFSDKNRIKWAYLLAFFLPNMVFWTSNIGKDSIIYFGIILIVYGLLMETAPKTKIFMIVAGSIIVYFIRPHIFLFLIVGFLFGLFSARRAFTVRSLFIFLAFFVTFLLLYQKVFEFVGISTEENENVIDHGINFYYHTGVMTLERNSKNLDYGGAAAGGSHKFNILYSPLYLVQFLGGPFLWQSRKPIQFFSALENLLYQFMIFYVLMHLKVFLKDSKLQFKIGWVSYIVLASVTMGMAYSNYGLAIREKCMVLPFVIIIFTSVYSQRLLKSKIISKNKPRMV